MRVSLSGSGTITITAHVTDETGIARVGPGFFQPVQLQHISGTEQNGIYQATFTFTRAAYDRILPFCSPKYKYESKYCVTNFRE